MGKTDAFVIDTENVEKAKAIFNFHNDIKGWRVSNYDSDIILPTKMHEVVEYELVDTCSGVRGVTHQG